MTTETSEIHVREKTKLILQLLTSGELEKAQNVILECKETLHYNLGLVNFLSLIPRIRFSKIIPKQNDALKMVINTAFQIYSEENNIEELIYFAAAKCNPEKLQFCVDTLITKDPAIINKTKEGDNVLMYLIKFGNIADENFLKCFKILIEAGIDFNKKDYFNHAPIIFLVNYYRLYTSKAKTKNNIVLSNLENAITLLTKIQRDKYSIDVTAEELMTEVDVSNLDKHFSNLGFENNTDELFKLLINKQESEFIKLCQKEKSLNFKEADDGNNTLLQLCCEKNLKNAARFLILNDVDLCKTTNRNRKPPLEIAARRNNYEIFSELLNTEKVDIDERLFVAFLQNRGRQIKSKYFDDILNYKGLNVDIKSNNNNTPLHYAIIFSNSTAVLNLLQRGASLLVENDSKKCPLDYISGEDLETYLDKCILPDNYNEIHSGKYEVALNFRSFVEFNNNGLKSELSIVEKVSNNEKLSNLIEHPVISSLIDLKWKISEPFYKKLLYFNIIFYLITILSYFQLRLLHYLSAPLFLIYTAKASLFFDWKNNKVHDTVDIGLAFIILVSNFTSNQTIQHQFGFVAILLMAPSFHLFWRFSPTFSDFHATLTVITTHILSYLFYIAIIIIFFLAGSNMYFLFQNKNEFEMYKDLYFLLVVISFFSALVLLTIVSCFVSLQESGLENIKNKFKASGCRNLLVFLKQVETLYLKMGDDFISNPFIFEEIAKAKRAKEDEKDSGEKQKQNKKKGRKKNKDKNMFLVNFYINVNKFLTEKLHAVKLQENNISKIQKFVKRTTK